MADTDLNILPKVLTLGQTLMNNASTARQNRKNRKFTEKMYEKERSNFLSDRDHTEQREDEKQAYAEWYNSPAHQRMLLEQANLGVGAFDMASATSPVVSGSGSTGSAPTSYDNMPMDFNLGADGVELFDKLAQRTRLAQAENIEADTAKKKSDLTIGEKRELRDQEQHDFNKEMWKFDAQRAEKEIRSLDLSNQEKVQALDHNRMMNLILERSASLDLDVKSKTHQDVIRLSRQSVQLNDARLKEMAQSFVTNGPQAFLAELTTEYYGKNRDSVIKMIQDQTNCSADEASIKAVNMALENEYVNSDTYKNSKKTGNYGLRSIKNSLGGTSDVGNLLVKGISLLK